MIVEVYRNIRARNWSVRRVETGRVAYHLRRVAVWDPVFHVSEAGRQRVLRERRKNVHAWVRGKLTTDDFGPLTRVVYDPYKYAAFTVEKTGEPIRGATFALFTEQGLFVGW